MFPVSLDCQLCFACLTYVSCVPDNSSVSRFSVVLCLSYFCVYVFVFLMFPVSLGCLLCFVCLISVSFVLDVSSVSRLSNVLSFFCVLCS